jgi:15-hydroxyprostaglandin dehydrogenase (NAD)
VYADCYASKLIGLARSAGPCFKEENLTINCILPGFVKTGLAPPEMIDRMPQEYVMPMSTVMRAYDMFLHGSEMTGQAVELSGDQIHFHSIPKYPDEISRWLHEDAKKLWNEVYAVGNAPKSS